MQKPINVILLSLNCYLVCMMSACISSQSGTNQGSTTPAENNNSGPQVPTLFPSNEVPTVSTGFALPDEITVVPIESGTDQLKTKKQGQPAKQRKMADKLESTTLASDYEIETPQLKVSARELEHFDTVNSILAALKQARYDDPRVLGQGPYAALIRWEEGESSRMEKWILDSRLEIQNNKIHHLIDLFIEESEGDKNNIVAGVDVLSPATLENPYGEWTVNARMTDSTSNKHGQFHAHVKTNISGKSEIHLRMNDIGPDHNYEGKGKLILTDKEGEGIFHFPDYYRDDSGIEKATMNTTRYAYNSSQLLVQQLKDNDESVALDCRNRNDYYDVTVDYNVYNEQGTNLKKINRYGFGLQQQVDDQTRYVWYGAHQGRHGIYTHNQTNKIEPGASLVATEDDGKIQAGDIFTFAGCRDGYLSQRVEKVTDTSELIGSLFHTWEYHHYRLKYVAESQQFFQCLENGYGDCDLLGPAPFELTLFYSSDEQHTHVSMYLQQSYNYQNVLQIVGGTGLYHAQTLEPIKIEDGAILDIYDHRVRFISFQNNQWFTYTHHFKPESHNQWDVEVTDQRPFTFLNNMEKYSIYGGRFEYHLKIQHNPDGPSSVTQVTRIIDQALNPLNDRFLHEQELFQQNLSENSLVGGFFYNADTGLLLDREQRPIKDWISNLYSPISDLSYQWNFDKEGREWGKVCYLKNNDNQFEILDPAIYFSSINLGSAYTGVFGYDGHIFGVPNYYEILKNNNGELPDNERNQIINIPDGTYATIDGDQSFHIRPRYGIRVLNKVPAESCHLSINQNIDLADLSEFVDPGALPFPKVEEILVIEGRFTN